MDKTQLLQMTTDIVASHSSVSAMSRSDLLREIGQVYNRLSGLSGDTGIEETQFGETPTRIEKIKPVEPFEAPFGADRIFCMVCGKGMKTLKRHLGAAHDLKPGQYRKRFAILAGTPLVAKRYSEARKKMAKEESGLRRKPFTDGRPAVLESVGWGGKRRSLRSGPARPPRALLE
jgi:predicted transcriptional regulator